MRLTELLKDYKAMIYTVDSNRIYEPKCNLCDDNRQVEYKTPLGRTAKEDCSCKTYTTKHEIREVHRILSIIRLNTELKSDITMNNVKNGSRHIKCTKTGPHMRSNTVDLF